MTRARDGQRMWPTKRRKQTERARATQPKYASADDPGDKFSRELAAQLVALMASRRDS